MGRLYRTEDCLKYKTSTLSDYPALKVRLYNMMLEEFPEELEIPVDTGFEGSLMLTASNYEFFKVGELPQSCWRSYRTLTGIIIMKVARAIAKIGDKELEIYVEAPHMGVGKRLIGRELLNKLILVLDGPARKCCISSIE
ncbi:MAG: pepsin/retropepsin-like aspartic protease family protein [Candidatus Nezhaarchaeales archaeon]